MSAGTKGTPELPILHCSLLPLNCIRTEAGKERTRQGRRSGLEQLWSQVSLNHLQCVFPLGAKGSALRCYKKASQAGSVSVISVREVWMSWGSVQGAEGARLSPGFLVGCSHCGCTNPCSSSVLHRQPGWSCRELSRGRRPPCALG